MYCVTRVACVKPQYGTDSSNESAFRHHKKQHPKNKAGDHDNSFISTYEVWSQGSVNTSTVSINHPTKQDTPLAIFDVTAKFQTLIHKVAQLSRVLGQRLSRVLGHPEQSPDSVPNGSGPPMTNNSDKDTGDYDNLLNDLNINPEVHFSKYIFASPLSWHSSYCGLSPETIQAASQELGVLPEQEDAINHQALVAKQARKDEEGQARKAKQARKAEEEDALRHQALVAVRARKAERAQKAER